MSSAAAIATYTGRYFPQDFEKKEDRATTPQRRPAARTIEIKHRERKGTEDGAK